MACYVPGIAPKISVGWSTRQEEEEDIEKSPELIFEFRYETIRTREIDGVTCVVERLDYPPVAVRWDFRQVDLHPQSDEQFMRKLETVMPILANLPPRTLESFRRDFPEHVRRAASRCRSERGVDEVKVVARLAVAVESGLAADCCPICLEEFEKGRPVLVNFVVLVCGHGFHYHCIDTWLDVVTTCPICRHII